MDIVIRPVNDQFLEQILFPVFEMGMVTAKTALERLNGLIGDDSTKLLLDVISEREEETAVFPLQTDKWLEASYRLLFSEWLQGPNGYQISSEYIGYASDWDETLHLALMLEEPRYPYADAEEAALAREQMIALPDQDLGLASLVAGRWDPCPKFAPDRVLATTGRGEFRSEEQLAVADWSYRQSNTVNLWAQQLPNKLGRLLKREETRLRPLEMPESKEILDYWMGKQQEPPMLAVAFSGLGQGASTWVRDLGALVRQIRNAASLEQGLTSIVTAPSGNAAEIEY